MSSPYEVRSIVDARWKFLDSYIKERAAAAAQYEIAKREQEVLSKWLDEDRKLIATVEKCEEAR